MSEIVSGFVSDAVNVSKNYANIPRNHRIVEVGGGILEVHSHPVPWTGPLQSFEADQNPSPGSSSRSPNGDLSMSLAAHGSA